MIFGASQTYGDVARHDTARVAAPWRRRWQASLWDLLAISLWLAALTVAGLLVRPVLPEVAEPPLPVVDLLVFAATVLPAWLYLTVTEGGAGAASWGKRRVGLRVVRVADASCPGWTRSAARNAVKLLPWQLAHLAVVRLWAGDTSVTVVVIDVVSLLIPIVSLVLAWRDGARRSLHDRVAGTAVGLAP